MVDVDDGSFSFCSGNLTLLIYTFSNGTSLLSISRSVHPISRSWLSRQQVVAFDFVIVTPRSVIYHSGSLVSFRRMFTVM